MGMKVVTTSSCIVGERAVPQLEVDKASVRIVTRRRREYYKEVFRVRSKCHGANRR